MADIFDAQPTCGEISCDECNERYAKAVARIASLEAENKSLKQCDTEDQAKFKAMVMFAARLTQALNVPLETSPSEMIEKIVSIEAELDMAIELLKRWKCTKWDESFGVYDVTLEDKTESFLASIGGEGKNG